MAVFCTMWHNFSMVIFFVMAVNFNDFCVYKLFIALLSVHFLRIV